jgi:uncharacterized protein YcbK (DUF882 family)
MLLAVFAASCSSSSEPVLELAQSTDSGAPAAALQIADVVPPAAPEQPAETPPPSRNEAGKEKSQAIVQSEPVTAAEAALAAVKPVGEGAGSAGAAAASPSGQVLENGGPILTAGTMPDVPIEPKKRSFLSSFFGSTPAEAKPAPAAPAQAREAKAKPVITLPDPNETKRKEEAAVRFASLGAEDDGVSGGGDFTLPGVRKTNLFEIKRKSGIDDDSDIDVYEDIGSYEVASAAGLARLAPNGLLKQRETVDTACLKPKLVRMLKQIESHFGKRLIVTSGYRSPAYNKKVRGAERSQHMYCAAVDVQMPGVHKFELARYARTMPGRGGVGTYCHSSIHIDIGPERDWNWKCGRKT